MTAKSPSTAQFSGNRLWLWVLAFFGLVLVAMVVAYLVKKAREQQAAKNGTGQNPAPTNHPVPPAWTPPTTGPSTSTPPFVPPSNTTSPVDKPVELNQVNWEYIREIAWKMNDTYLDRKDYRCEVTNGIIEMGENDLRALAQLYKQWYSRSLKIDYCTKITASGCWTSWWDDKPAAACSRLKTLN